MANVLNVPVLAGKASILWPARTDPSISTLLLINQDLNNTVYIGNDVTITASTVGVVPIPPNGSLNVSPASTWYVTAAANGVMPLVVVPNGQNNFRGITQAVGELAIPSVRSPDFVTGVSGWTINKDGSAEFNNLTVRGTFFGINYIISSIGAFFYSSSPALGNLIASITASTGTEGFGNHYGQGINSYVTIGGKIYAISLNQTGGPSSNAGLSIATLTSPPNSPAGVFGDSSSTTADIIVTSGKKASSDTAALILMFSAQLAGLVNGSAEIKAGFITVGATDTVVVNDNSGALTMTNTVVPPPNPGLGGSFYADATSGTIKIVDGNDGVSYAIETMHDILTVNTSLAAAPGTTVITTPVSQRYYKISGTFQVNVSGVAQQLSVGIGVPGGAGANGLFAVKVTRAAVLVAATSFGPNALTAIGPAASLAVGDTYIVDIDGAFLPGAAGNLNITMAATNASDLDALAFSYLDISPQ